MTYRKFSSCIEYPKELAEILPIKISQYRRAKKQLKRFGIGVCLHERRVGKNYKRKFIVMGQNPEVVYAFLVDNGLYTKSLFKNKLSNLGYYHTVLDSKMTKKLVDIILRRKPGRSNRNWGLF